MNTPPDPLWPSGICSVIVHQIVNLEFQHLKGSQGKRKGREFEPAQPSGENKDEEHKKLPSGYCTILFNDDLVSQPQPPDNECWLSYDRPTELVQRL